MSLELDTLMYGRFPNIEKFAFWLCYSAFPVVLCQGTIVTLSQFPAGHTNCICAWAWLLLVHTSSHWENMSTFLLDFLPIWSLFVSICSHPWIYWLFYVLTDFCVGNRRKGEVLLFSWTTMLCWITFLLAMQVNMPYLSMVSSAHTSQTFWTLWVKHCLGTIQMV